MKRQEDYPKPKTMPFPIAYEYKILQSVIHESLSAKVVQYLKEGWTLVGGVAVTADYFYQAVTKVVNT